MDGAAVFLYSAVFLFAQNQKGSDAMYFTSGSNCAFEHLMQDKTGFDHYDSGGKQGFL